MNKIDTKGLRTWIEVDEKKLSHNYKQLKKISNKNTKFCAVVKSNAYGHGLVDYSKAVSKLSIEYLAVDSIVEAVRLRKEGIKKEILVLGFTLPEMLPSAFEKKINITVSNFETLTEVIKYVKKHKNQIKIHIKIDTGMHRQGFQQNDIKKMIEILKREKEYLKVEGIYTHFAEAKDPNDKKFTNKQITEFEYILKDLKKEFPHIISHVSATAGLVLYNNHSFDMVRVGIGLLGYYPSRQIQNKFSKILKLKPILSWFSLVGELKQIKKGESVGYDRTWIAKRNSKIAIIPVGYWHGLPRSLSNSGYVFIQNKKCKIIGLVSMDMIIVDVTDVKVKILDKVSIIDSNKKIFATDHSKVSKQSHYEFLTRINPLIKKIYTQN